LSRYNETRIHPFLRQHVDQEPIVRWFTMASENDVLELLAELCESLLDPQGLDVIETGKVGDYDPLLRCLAAWSLNSRQSATGLEAAQTNPEFVEKIKRFYSLLGPKVASRHHLLLSLASSEQPDDLEVLVDLLLDDPPVGEDSLAQVFVPLFRAPPELVLKILPRLMTGLENPQIASFVLDLANFLYRHHRLLEYPATGRGRQLVRLLEGLVAGLEKLQSSAESAVSASSQDRTPAAEGLPLVISLCDALALMGEETAIPILESVLELKHRRVRVEAAAALARLGDESGAAQLVELAAEPVARLRVLAYAEELDIQDRLPEEFSTPVAVAQAELVSHLAAPNQFGVPPTTCELVDSKTLYWPGFEEPRACFLFRFTYQAVDRQQETFYSNIGIAGPLSHYFMADLEQLELEDAYAIFAGWQAEHGEIFEQDYTSLRERDCLRMDRMVFDLEAADYGHVSPVVAASFFGEDVLVARAQKDGIDGVVVYDQRDTNWFPATSDRPLEPADAINLYKGRRLLGSFND
jgi:hypothetical protein